MAPGQGLTAVLQRRATLATWRVTGADRHDYLHRMLTQDLRGLAVGQATYACFLTVQGRILGDMLLWNAGDHLLLELEEEAAAAVLPGLERYVIADDVLFEDVTSGSARYSLAGPEAAATLARAGFEAPPPGAFVEIECGGLPGRILRFDRRRLAIYELAVAPRAADALEERLALERDGAAFEAALVQHGVPRFGHELGQDVLLNEAGLEEAIAWGKGCFPGQEPVVMARHRGRPPRRLVRLRLEGSAAPGAGLHADGTLVGQVTSVAGARALGYVKHALAAEGAVFEVEGGGRAVASVAEEA